MDELVKLLGTGPGAGIVVLLLFVIGYLFRAREKERDEHMKTALYVMPIAEKLTKLADTQLAPAIRALEDAALETRAARKERKYTTREMAIATPPKESK